MPISFGKNAVVLEGECMVEEALPLLEHLQSHPKSKVSMKGCVLAHSAVLQILMAARPVYSSLPEEEFMRRWLAPALKGAQ